LKKWIQLKSNKREEATRNKVPGLVEGRLGKMERIDEA